MPARLPAGQRPTVFISYAHESEALRSSVKVLANWLGNQGCNVLTDHAYLYRPPDVGWQAWMLDCINKAETVLVVCTPKLKLRYEKNAPLDTGRGATYEGAIVTQHLYDDAMRNTKFFPILPDNGHEGDIPRTLKPWWNDHRFPSGNNGIRQMIFAETGVIFAETEATKNDPEKEPSQLDIPRVRKQKGIVAVAILLMIVLALALLIGWNYQLRYSLALKISELLGDRAGMARSYHQLGMVAQDRGELDVALESYRKVLEISEQLGDRAGMARSYHQLGMVAQDRGELDVALESYRKALAVRHLDSPSPPGVTLPREPPLLFYGNKKTKSAKMTTSLTYSYALRRNYLSALKWIQGSILKDITPRRKSV